MKPSAARFVLLAGLALAALLAVTWVVRPTTAGTTLRPEKYIAHGGGTVGGRPCTSSLEALNESYKHGFRFIELDFNWTTDNELALIHDWERASWLFHRPGRASSLAEFMNAKMVDGLTQLSLASLATWLTAHPAACIVTDIKTRNVEGLRMIAQRYPQLAQQILPQIYQLQEYGEAQALGYRNIILTLYACPSSDSEIIAFCRRHKLLAVTMPCARASTTDLPRKLSDLGLFVYTHTVNTKELAQEQEAKKVSGFYTDDLRPP